MLKRVHFPSTSVPVSVAPQPRVKDFETLLDSIGGWNLYQKRLWIIVYVIMEAVISINTMQVFYALQGPDSNVVEYKCRNESVTQAVEATLLDNATQKEKTCKILQECDGELEFGSQTLAVESRYYCGNGAHLLKMARNVQVVGILVGALFWGQVSHHLGRKRVLLTIYASSIIFGFIYAANSSFTMAVVAIFGLTTAAGGYWCVGACICQETVRIRSRLFIAVLNGWPLAMMLFMAMCFLFENYRHMAYLTNGVGALVTLCFFYIVESPRWLLSRGRVGEAAAAMRTIAATNGKPAPDMTLIAVFAHPPACASYHNLFSTKDRALQMAVLLYSWFVMGFTTQVLSLYGRFHKLHQYFSNFMIALISGAVIWSVLAFGNRLGRRKTHQGSLLITGICCIGCAIYQFVAPRSYGSPFKVLAAIGSMVIGPTWPMCYLYSVELYTASTRSLSNSLGSVAARLGYILCFHVFMHPHIMSILIVCILVNIVLAFFFLPETKDSPLPEDFLPPSPPAVPGASMLEAVSAPSLLARNGHATSNASDDLARYDIVGDEPIDCDDEDDLPVEYIVIGRHQTRNGPVG